MKPVNRYTSSEFHDWVRGALPSRLVIQDIDAWALPIADPNKGDFAPIALIELKRSYLTVEEWRPYRADLPNYSALLWLARAAGVPLYVVYFRKGVEIDDATLLHIFRLDGVEPNYYGAHRVMTARDFAARFPDPLRRSVA